VKKKAHNGRRRGCSPGPGGGGAASPANEPRPEENQPEAAVVSYVRMVVSLIEGWRVGTAAIRQMLARAVRQRSMARRRRIDYVVDQLKRDGP
jgi:hypothetical protein